MDKKTNTQIGIRVNEEFKKRIEERADEEGRTMSNLIINVMKNYLDEIDKAKNILKK